MTELEKIEQEIQHLKDKAYRLEIDLDTVQDQLVELEEERYRLIHGD